MFENDHDPHNDPIFDPREDEYRLECLRDSVLKLEHEALRQILLPAFDKAIRTLHK